ncbi:pyrimidine 5'-nucleotidase [Microthyrium microscopicum]|uniref:Pyrimidine 5'-nucleotidase n=1 Tax=Microthyrium microscopicum TaxID=703497 RepID=A0A6A6U7G9_9PEZI|nr:pyrimidine 5'-nucleotidase [Microthyrium microscopicum]
MPKPTAGRKVLFMDIDNCLYSKSLDIQILMGDLIDDYFQTHLELTRQDAFDLHKKYYQEYGLAIKGLVLNHHVDALDFNAKVDDALPLEDILEPNPQLRKLLEDIDTAKVKLWLLTNAYKTHGMRVVKLLGIDDLFEGITYCDYGAEVFLAKPQEEMWVKAMKEAQVESKEDCYFVDDSYLNAAASQRYGWTTAHLIEPSEKKLPRTPASAHQIRSLEELRTIFPDFFKTS